MLPTLVIDRAICRINVILNRGALFGIGTMLVVFAELFLDCSISLCWGVILRLLFQVFILHIYLCCSDVDLLEGIFSI